MQKGKQKENNTYRVKTFDKITFKGSERIFKDKKKAVKRFEELKAKDEPAYLLVMLRAAPMFTTWASVKDEKGKDVISGIGNNISITKDKMNDAQGYARQYIYQWCRL